MLPFPLGALRVKDFRLDFPVNLEFETATMHLQVSKINWKLGIQNQIPEIWNWTSSKFEMRAQVPADRHGG